VLNSTFPGLKRHFGTNPDLRIRTFELRIRILPFSSVADKMLTNNKFFVEGFFSYYFLKVHLYQFSLINSQREVTNSRNQSFSYFICLLVDWSRTEKIITETEPGGPKKYGSYGIWIQIHNTANYVTVPYYFQPNIPQFKSVTLWDFAPLFDFLIFKAEGNLANTMEIKICHLRKIL
jgi:hypothetical protein